MTRTHTKFLRAYVGGYDLSGETRSIGPLSWDHEFADEQALTWDVTGGLNGRAIITTGQVNTILRHETASPATSPHDWINTLEADNTAVLVPFGLMAAPVAGDPCWMAIHRVKLSQTTAGSGAELVTTTVDFSQSNMVTDSTAALLNFPFPWGTLAHAKAARTAANTATGVDGGAATSAGAWMVCQIFECVGSGTVTITLQDAAINQNASFAAVTGLTTGSIATASIPCAVVAQTATNASIRQYTRWQIALGGSMTSVTFALAFARGR